jgi:uncharacterized protein with gpF-like domain
MKILPPKEALKYWAQKIVITPDEYAALADDVKNLAFSVADLQRSDLVQDVYDMLQEAIAGGQPFGDFQEALGDALEGLGWGGSEQHRAKLVYHNAVSTAYSAGHSQQLDADADIFPYRRYVCTLQNTRDSHAIMHNMILRSDDPAWDRIYTPNGHNCACDVEGVMAASPDQVRSGVGLSADPGWGGNPGRDWLAKNAAMEEEKLKNYTGFVADDYRQRKQTHEQEDE